MVLFNKYHLPTVYEQKICILLYNNGGVITFKEQQIYKHNKSFKKAMNELVKWKAVVLVKNNKWPFTNSYQLTESGVIFVTKVLKL